MIVLDRKTLEPSLIQVPAPAGVVMLVMPPDVRDADPTHQIGQRLLPPRTEDEMPVIGHQAPRQQVDRVTFQPLAQHTHKPVIIRRLVKQRHPPVPAVQNMIESPGGNFSKRACHVDTEYPTG